MGTPEGVTPAPTPVVARTSTSDGDKMFSQDDIERARQQEKSKVYSRLEELQAEMKTLQAERDERLSAEQTKAAADAEAARLRAESEMDVRQLLELKEQEWNQRLSEERAEREKALALLQKEREWSQLESYKSQALRAAEDSILPELLDDVAGNTREEIDASIARISAKSQSILQNASAVLGQQRQSAQGARVTAPTTGPMEDFGGAPELSASDISNLSMSEYAAQRAKFGVNGGPSQRGLFG